MEKTIKTYYRVVTPPGFSDIECDTYEEAIQQLVEFGTCHEKATTENIKYWKRQQQNSKIIKVTEIIEDIS